MIKLKDLLSEGKFKIQGKYLYMSTGEVSSIPEERDKEKILFKDNKGLIIGLHKQKGKFYIDSGHWDKYLKNNNELVNYLNKGKFKYIGIDNRW